MLTVYLQALSQYMPPLPSVLQATCYFFDKSSPRAIHQNVPMSVTRAADPIVRLIQTSLGGNGGKKVEMMILSLSLLILHILDCFFFFFFSCC